MAEILVVDDDADGREVLSLLLARAGHHVSSAVNGREALLAVATSIPEIIILDARMPEMSGIDFLVVIRSYLRWSTIPVIMLSAYPEEVPLERMHRLGVKITFVKGNYRADELLACVNRLAADPNARCDAAG